MTIIQLAQGRIDWNKSLERSFPSQFPEKDYCVYLVLNYSPLSELKQWLRIRDITFYIIYGVYLGLNILGDLISLFLGSQYGQSVFFASVSFFHNLVLILW